jgi:hypothetical protein
MKNNRIIGFCQGLCLLIAAVPAAAAGDFYYLFEVQPSSLPSGATLPGWSASWKSNKPLSLEIGKNVVHRPSFSLSGAPVAGLPITNLFIRKAKKPGKSGVYPVDSEAVWGRNAQISYLWEFEFDEQPDAVGVYTAALVGADYGTIPLTGATVTLTIQNAPFSNVVGVGQGQTVRLSVVLAPGRPAASVVLGFAGLDGQRIGSSATVLLSPGQVASIDLDTAGLITAREPHMNVRPVISEVSGSLLPPVEATAEVFDSRTGSGSVLAGAAQTSRFGPIGIAASQTMRLVALADSGETCHATLSFADQRGVPVGTSLRVDLDAGQAQFVELNGNTLGLKGGERAEIQPRLALDDHETSSCAASAETFDSATGRAVSHQSVVASNIE